MSGFEMHRFRTIDRPLSQEEMNEIDSWSSRFSPTSTGVTYIYHYGSFKKDAGKVFPKFFDAMLYVDSWGTRQLMFRFPKKLVKWSELIDYTNIMDESSLDFRKAGDFIVMEMIWSQEEGGDWMEEEDYLLDPLLSLRQEILNGDYRGLMLCWLKIHQLRLDLHGGMEGDFSDFEEEFLDDFEEDELMTPPIPAGLKKLNAGHSTFMEIFELEEDLVAAAAMKSPVLEVKKTNYQALLKNLTAEQKEDYLLRLLMERSGLGLELRKKLDAFENGNSTVNDNRLSWEELQENLKSIGK
jgi:hypothetical protein